MKDAGTSGNHADSFTGGEGFFIWGGGGGGGCVGVVGHGSLENSGDRTRAVTI